MKEATSELNLTVVVILIVAVLSFFFFGTIWPNIKSNFAQNTKCDEAICANKPNDDGKTVDCYVKGEPNVKITCTWKG